jgi:uncharacterized membrane protein
MFGVNGKFRFGLYPPISIIFIVILITLIFSQFSRGADFIDEDLWSEDVQLTDHFDHNYKYLSMLNVQETTGGAFQIMYARQPNGASFQLSNMYTDKLGRTPTPVANTTKLENWEYRGHTHVSEKSIYHNEATDTIRFITRDGEISGYIWFVRYSEEFELLEKNRFHVSDLFEDVVGFKFTGTADVYWDAEGNAHLAGMLSKENDDGTKLFRVYYAFVTWGPLSISVSTVHYLPPLDFHSVVPRIHTNEEGVVAITHLDYFNGNFYRAISWKNATETWETTIIDDMVNPTFSSGMAANGIYVDNSDAIHLVWADSSFQLKYLRLDKDRSVGIPRTISSLPVSRIGGMIDVQFQTNSSGNIFLAFNVVPYNSKYRWISDIPPAIVVIPLRNDDIVLHHEKYVIVDNPTATEFVFHIDADNNFYIIWFDTRTGLTQIFLKYLATPGLTFEFDLVEWADAQTIRPDETKYVNLLLKNVGSLELGIILHTETDAGLGWNVVLDSYRAHLEAYDNIPVTLTIHCPSNATDGEVIQIWINATTLYNEYSANLRLFVFVKWERELEVHFTRIHNIIDPGGTVAYFMSLQNVGEMSEVVDISLTQSGSDEWGFSPETAKIILSPDEATIIEISVTAPMMALENDVFGLLIEFHWADGKTAHNGIVLRTVVRPTFFVTMKLNRTEASVRPGETVGFNITIGNAGNMGGTAFVEITILSDPGDWMVLLSSETVPLLRLEAKLIHLLATAPPDALGREIMIIKLRAYCPTPFSEVEREIRIVVKEIHSMEWTSGPLSWDLPPNGVESRPFELSNNGNQYEVVRFRLEGLRDNWGWWMDEGGSETAAVRIEPREHVALLVWLSVPANSIAGKYNLQMYLETEGITFGHITLEVHIDHIGDLELKGLSTGLVAYPGGYFDGTFEVFNRGNGPEVVEIAVSSDYLESPIVAVEGLNSTSVWVPVGGSRTVNLVGRLSESVPEGLGHVSVKIHSKRDQSVEATVDISYDIWLPDLSVIAVEIIPSRPQINEVITIHLVLCNKGPIEIIDVRASIFGGVEERIASIAPEGETIAVFTWVSPVPGEIDVSGIVTYGPGNYSLSWSTPIVITSSQSVDRFPFVEIFLVLIVALSGLGILTTRKYSKTPKQL